MPGTFLGWRDPTEGRRGARMSKTGKRFPPPAAESGISLEQAALRICKEAGEQEAAYRDLVKEYGVEKAEELAAKLLEVQARNHADYVLEVISGEQQASSDEHREIINLRHDQPGGSREKRRRMRDLWATGNFSSKEECATKSHEALGMSFDTAIKALRNAPKAGPVSMAPAVWLRDLIAGGPLSSAHIYREAKAAGYSKDAMKRAKKAIGATSIKQGKEWLWCLGGAHPAATP